MWQTICFFIYNTEIIKQRDWVRGGKQVWHKHMVEDLGTLGNSKGVKILYNEAIIVIIWYSCCIKYNLKDNHSEPFPDNYKEIVHSQSLTFSTYQYVEFTQITDNILLQILNYSARKSIESPRYTSVLCFCFPFSVYLGFLNFFLQIPTWNFQSRHWIVWIYTCVCRYRYVLMNAHISSKVTSFWVTSVSSTTSHNKFSAIETLSSQFVSLSLTFELV